MVRLQLNPERIIIKPVILSITESYFLPIGSMTLGLTNQKEPALNVDEPSSRMFYRRYLFLPLEMYMIFKYIYRTKFRAKYSISNIRKV